MFRFYINGKQSLNNQRAFIHNTHLKTSVPQYDLLFTISAQANGNLLIFLPGPCYQLRDTQSSQLRRSNTRRQCFSCQAKVKICQLFLGENKKKLQQNVIKPEIMRNTTTVMRSTHLKYQDNIKNSDRSIPDFIDSYS